MATSANRDPPTTLAYCIATAILAALGGYFLGQASSLGLIGGDRSQQDAATSDTPSESKAQPRGTAKADEKESESENEEDPDSEDEQQDLQGFESNANEECKLVLVVRTDLGMTKGKIAAQCGHATLACYKALLNLSKSNPSAHNLLRRWERYGQAKVAVQVKSEEELEMLHAMAMSLGICARIIHDAGRTQIAANSATVLGVGPAPKSMVDEVTGRLKLL